MTIIINGSNTPIAGAVAVGDGTTLAFTAVGTSGQILRSNGASVPTWTNNDTGTVTSASVVSANGFAGTVANASTTPAITLSTTITGLVKGNGTAISAATAGTDYLAPPSGTALLKANSGGALANATAGTDYCAATSGSGILKGSSGNTTTATAGTDYVAPNGALGTPSSGTLSSCTVDGTYSVGFRKIPPVGAKTSSYTLAINDVGKYVEISTGGSIVVPASVFTSGDAISIYNNTAGNITITTSAVTAFIAGTNTVKTSITLATRGIANILYIDATGVVVTGNVS